MNFKHIFSPIDETQTGITTLDLSGPMNNSKKEYPPKSPELESYHRLQFSVIPKNGFDAEGNTIMHPFYQLKV